MFNYLVLVLISSQSAVEASLDKTREKYFPNKKLNISYKYLLLIYLVSPRSFASLQQPEENNKEEESRMVDDQDNTVIVVTHEESPER